METKALEKFNAPGLFDEDEDIFERKPKSKQTYFSGFQLTRALYLQFKLQSIQTIPLKPYESEDPNLLCANSKTNLRRPIPLRQYKSEVLLPFNNELKVVVKTLERQVIMSEFNLKYLPLKP